MTIKTRLAVAGATLTLLALTGCAGPGKATNAGPAAPPSGLHGKVAETMDAGGYTYIGLERQGKRTWVAVPVTKVTVGQEVSLLPGAEIKNFASKSLNRTFDSIIFSGGMDPSATPAAAPTVKVDPRESVEPILAGKVVETMDAANYTYICLEKDGKISWSAVPQTEVKVGDEIELLPGNAMGKFTSKRLNRTFNAIYFAGGVKGKGEGADAAAAAPATPQLPAGHPKVDAAAQGAAPAAPAAAPAADKLLSGKVVETTDAGGYTYICLEKDGQKTWVAVPPARVEVGQEVSVAQGVAMTNFVSKSLNRTFEKIIFSSGMAAK